MSGAGVPVRGAGIPVNGAGIPVRGAVLARIPSEQYSDYRYEAIFRAYKWDPQVEDHNTVAEHVVLLDKQTAGRLEHWAEQLSAETMAISLKNKKGYSQNRQLFPGKTYTADAF